MTDKTPVRDLPGVMQFSKTVSESDVYTFAGITGDYYPVHIDEVYSATQPVGERIAHGIYILGLMSTAGGKWMMANSIDGLSYGYDKVRFIEPVFLGDTVTVSYAKVEESEDGRQIRSRAEARNQHDDVVAVGQHLIWCNG